jgi:hypothetical protein
VNGNANLGDATTDLVTVGGNLTMNGTDYLKVASGTTAQRNAIVTPVNGMIRYNSDLTAFEGYAANTWAPIGGGGTVDKITQALHGFSVGDVLYLNGTTYAKAIASASNTSEVIGLVSRVVNSNEFELTLSGEITVTGPLTPGGVYFLSDATAGLATLTEPSTLGAVSVPLGVASTTTTFYVALKRGVVLGGTNARTQINLSNNTTNTVQNVASYDAGEIVGWVYIDATTDYRFLLKAQFAKKGDASNWNLSYQTVGDTPPAGFSFSINSVGVIEYTMPNVTGFVSAIFNYALNAPAIGASFPLSVSGTNVVGGTPTVDTVNEYTTNNGVQIQGRKSGTAIASGYVGENFSQTSVLSTVTSGTYNALVTVNMTAGIYLISGIVGYLHNGATITNGLGVAGISTSARGFTSSDRNTTSIIFNFINYTFGGEGAVSLPSFLVRVDGSNIYFPNGVTSTSDRALKLVLYPGTFTGGPVTAGGSLYIVRIA